MPETIKPGPGLQGPLDVPLEQVLQGIEDFNRFSRELIRLERCAEGDDQCDPAEAAATLDWMKGYVRKEYERADEREEMLVKLEKLRQKLTVVGSGGR